MFFQGIKFFERYKSLLITLKWFRKDFNLFGEQIETGCGIG